MKDTIEEMEDYFWFCGAFRGRVHSINVSTKTRKQWLIDNPRNMVTVNCGQVLEIVWKNLGGGVWQATVEIPE
ncbi:hypothetical protein [Pseudomonas phage vB_PsaM_M1]|nr:hypothetical protein [Pseudomonas phage vB_PsaM_M1]